MSTTKQGCSRFDARQKRVGIVVSSYSSGFYGTLLDHAVRQLESYGYSVISKSTKVSSTPGKTGAYDQLEYDAWKSLLQTNCDGLILHAKLLSDEQLADMIQRGPKTVLINRFLEDYPYQSVPVNNGDGARLAAAHLVEMGHTRVAMITGPKKYSDVVERSRGFLSELAKWNLSVPEDLIEVGNYTFEGGAQAFRRLLQTDRPFSVVFAQNDRMAAGVVHICQAEGISVPDEISVIGYDGSFFGGLTQPKLTTVKYPIDKAGTCAAKILHGLLENHTPASVPDCSKEHLKPTLVVRDSVHNKCARQEKSTDLPLLTQREYECLQNISIGNTSSEVAGFLHIAEDTVNFHLRNVIHKLQARNRTHAVTIALSRGYLRSPFDQKSSDIEMNLA
ncbi:MAG: substrate-binding domain-containing protein [Gammaproteobacteria bacterium]|nr:substrate-binding domain-containing protein [Gammaproteobacteria bacterium]